MEFERRKRYTPMYLNIAALVDVVFLLLLFFMLTSHLIEQPLIKIKLPESKTAQPEDKPTTFTIYISKENDIYFMDKIVALEELRVMIKNSLKDMQNVFIRIKADRESDVGRLVGVIDELRLCGIKNYSIVTKRAHIVK